MFSFSQDYNLPMIAVCVVGCLLGRALNVFPLSFVINKVRPDHPVPKNHQVKDYLLFIILSFLRSFFYFIFFSRFLYFLFFIFSHLFPANS